MILNLQWIKSSVGRKAIVAFTGLVLVGFIIGHLVGNLLIFAGPDALNAYAKKLRDLGGWLWAIRIVLLVMFAIHVWASIQLTWENRMARPIAYRVYRTRRTSYATRNMIFSGLLLLAYIAYHLLHLTFRVTNPEISVLTDALGGPDVYAMAVKSFQNIYISAAYIVAMVLLYAHLAHGISSSCQSLGLTNERVMPILERFGNGAALILLLGYISIPVAVLLGLVSVP